MMRAPFPCTTRERGDQYSNRRSGSRLLTCVGGHNPYRLRGFRPVTHVRTRPDPPMSGERSGPCPEHRVAGGCSCGMVEGRFAELIAGQRQGVLVTLRKDGRPQLSNVNYAWYPEEQTIRVSTTDDRAKTGNMRRDPRVSFHVTSGDFWSYVVVDGHAELSEVARDPHDAAVEELVDLYRAVQGDHPDWDDYRAAMVRDRRLVLRLRAERAYGMVHRG